MAVDVSKIDLYGLLDVLPDATEQEIRTAYRKGALKNHPDKNPGDADARERFEQIGRALQILSDESARAAYDSVRKAKHAAAERSRLLDSKRKKFKDDLEAREKAAAAAAETAGPTAAQAARNLEAEIKRLRKEGSHLLEQEQELLREQIRQERQAVAAATAAQAKASEPFGNSNGRQDSAPCLFVKWKERGSPAATDGHVAASSGAIYDESTLIRLFSKYGKVVTVLLSKKKKKQQQQHSGGGGGGSAVIEFASGSGSNLAAADSEPGLCASPLEARWCRGAPAADVPLANRPVASSSGSHTKTQCTTAEPDTRGKRSSDHAEPATASTCQLDYESLVLRHLRQAEERRRLIEQMKAEDAASMASAEEKG